MLRCTIPEGPEVKLSTENVKEILKMASLNYCNVYNSGRYKANPPENFDLFLQDVRLKKVDFLDVNNKGKLMYWTFTNDWYMFCTFGMTGQWSKEPTKHSCFSFSYEIPPTRSLQLLYFNDARHFGTIRFFKSEKILKEKLDSLGWDPLNERMTKEQMDDLEKYLSKSNKPIGQILMDQKIFCGVGNYIRAEALYLARISPWRPANMLSKSEILLLCNACCNVMTESYNKQGATIFTYKTVDGKNGNYSDFFHVYGKKKDPQGNEVIKENTPGGRSVHWVPRLQS